MDNDVAEDTEEPSQPKRTRKRSRKVDFDNLSKKCSQRLRSELKHNSRHPPVLDFELSSRVNAQMSEPLFASTPSTSVETPEEYFFDCQEFHENAENFDDCDSLQNDDDGDDVCPYTNPLFTDEPYIFEDQDGFGEKDPNSAEEDELDSPLYKGATYSVWAVMLALMTLAITHSISATCLGDILKLLKLILPKDNKLTSSLFLFFKHFEKFQSNSERHYYCNVCKTALPTKASLCEHCGPNTVVSFFIHISVEKQLKKLLQIPGFFDKLSYSDTRSKTNNAAYEDILDGEVYKDAKTNWFGTITKWLTFLWNTDGFCLFRSSQFEVWPFYLAINELPPHLRFRKENMLLGGLWFGIGKPSPNLFLKPLYDELIKLRKGFSCFVFGLMEPITLQVGLLAGTCDAPAKATFLSHMFFNGKFGCTKCLSRGEKSARTKNVFVYPYEQNLQLRTETNYLQHLVRLRNLRENNVNVRDVMGIKGPTVLKNMLISSLIDSTSIDVMHCLFQGVFKTLVTLWFGDTCKDETFNNVERKDVVSHFLTGIKPPHCIQRVAQSLDKLKFWKASEFQSFFFYYSLPILSLVIEQVYFNHFKLLYLGIALLCRNSISEDDLVLSQSLLDQFVEEYSALYGLNRMTSNLHALRHLPSVVRKLGPLWATSCFMFEDLNGILKYIVHGTQYVGIQVQKNFELLTQLPVMLSDLQASQLKDFCVNISKSNSRLHVSECIGSNMEVIGFFRKEGNETYFSRLRINSFLFESSPKDKNNLKDSSFITYKLDGDVHHGMITNFKKVTNCNDAEYFALVQHLQCSVAFQTTHTGLDLFTTFLYETTDVIHTIPVTDIKGLCVNVTVENKSYVIDFMNNNFFQ